MTSQMVKQASMLPSVSVVPCDVGYINELLVDWEHPLEDCNRPFGSQAWFLEVAGAPVAVALSASTVSKTITDEQGRSWSGRSEIVELARIARHPDHPFVMRVMLRLWREYLARSWPYWPIGAVISYQLPGTRGDIYRFDGWTKVRVTQVSRGGGTWTIKNLKVSQIGDGRKTLWIYRYEAAS